MTVRTNVKLESNVVPNRYTKFWTKSIMEETTTDDDSSDRIIDSVEVNEPSSINKNYTYTIKSNSSFRDTIIHKTHHENNQLSRHSDSSTKRHQTKMLLVSLLEHFCRAYGDTPESNRKVFFLICQTLRSLGIVDAEFVDEMTHVRSAFQKSFHKLFFTAVETVRNQDLVDFDDNSNIIKFENSSDSEPEIDSSTDSSSDNLTPEPSSSTTSASALAIHTSKSYPSTDHFTSHSHASHSLPSSFSHKLSTSAISASSLHSFIGGDGDFFYNLSVQNSRYNNDFVEINLLGKGGFASAFKARNRLDGICYAIKKIRLGNDIKECDNKKDNPYERIFREIKNLARLEHHNVIRYYGSWLEYDESNSDDVLSSDESDWEEDSSKHFSGRHSDIVFEDESSIFKGKDPTFSEHSASSWCLNGDESGMSHIQFGECSTSGYNAGINVDTAAAECPPWSKPLDDGLKSTSYLSKDDKKTKSGWTLFIQMQLCPTTLHDYIRFRNKQFAENLSYDIIDTKRNIEIFSQILEGTAYIHDQGLIHRDLKPSNIFLSMPSTLSYINHSDGKRRRRRVSSAGPCLESNKNSFFAGLDLSAHSSPEYGSPKFSFENSIWEESWVPKIGDFGLAAEVMDENEGLLIPTPISSTPPSPKISPLIKPAAGPKDIQNASNPRVKKHHPTRTRTVGVGTRTYASPEQLAVPAQGYDEKVDIYSLGIILFELFQPFSTGMERADSIEKLKKGVFPTGFLELYPKVTALIIWMMDTNPQQRPTAHQLLKFELFSHPSVQDDGDLCLTLKTQLQSKNSLIDHKNKEIDELKMRLQEVEMQKQSAIEEMQKKLEEMQYKLNQYEHKNEYSESSEKSQQVDDMRPYKKSILTPTSSFLKRKKEVRWSPLE